MSTLDDVLQGQGLWLDAQAYTARLLADGQPPWMDTTACLAYLSKAQGLLSPSLQQLPLDALITAHLSARPELKAAMAQRSRPLFPVKTLLADEPFRAQVSELATALCSATSGVPTVLTLPMPGDLARQLYAQAHGDYDEDDFEAEDAEDTASYLADFLRSLADSGIAGLVFVAGGDVSDEDWSYCQPVNNVAAHYRWPTGIELPAGCQWAGGAPGGMSFAVSNSPVEGVASFIWGADSTPLRAHAIAADANPEDVLATLERIRP